MYPILGVYEIKDVTEGISSVVYISILYYKMTKNSAYHVHHVSLTEAFLLRAYVAKSS